MRNRAVLIVVLVGLWWAFAFRPSSPETVIAIPPSHYSSNLHLSLDRNRIIEALRGNFSLMGSLMSEWDIEAQLLEMQGAKPQKRLTHEQFLRGQLLSRTLKKEPHSSKFLPQSYAAATILLSIAHPEQIVALPKGLRDQKQLFPKSMTDKIPFDIDRFNSEKLSKAKPDLAFVSSHYSHPATIEALRNQGIAIVMHKSLHSFSSIQETITEIGKYAGRPEEAELLNLFMEAALFAIDNQLDRKPILHAVYVQAFMQLTTPFEQTFTHEILSRLKLNNGLKSGIILDQERLCAINPDYLIVSTTYPEAMQTKLLEYKELKAVREGQIYLLDDVIQQSANQFAVLAYYDLAQAVR